MKGWQVDVPEGRSGEWAVERFSVNRHESAMSFISYRGRYVLPGTYTRLVHGGQVVMSDTPAEQGDHLPAFLKVREMGGRVLINGLGLGMFLGRVLSVAEVEAVEVVELSEDVLRLVSGHYRDPRVTYHHGDALKVRLPGPFTVAWHDIWTSNADESECRRLVSAYRLRARWQGCWGRERNR